MHKHTDKKKILAKNWLKIENNESLAFESWFGWGVIGNDILQGCKEPLSSNDFRFPIVPDR